MYKIKLLTYLLTLALFVSCASKENHILVNPISAVWSNIENVNYSAKEKKVSNYVEKYYDLLKREIKKGEGIHIEEVLRIASIKNTKFSTVKLALKKDYSTIFHNVEIISELIIHSFSRLYMPKSKDDKTMNGFTFTQAWNIIQNHVDNKYDLLQSDVKNKQHKILIEIANDLHINDAKKRTIFLNSLDNKYKSLYLDLLTTSIMVHTN